MAADNSNEAKEYFTIHHLSEKSRTQKNWLEQISIFRELVRSNCTFARQPMTHHELTFNRAVAMTTAAISAGQLNYADHDAIENAIVLFYDLLLETEFVLLSD
jgi:adenosine deaminase